MKQVIVFTVIFFFALVSCKQNQVGVKQNDSANVPAVRIKTVPVVRMDMMDTVHIYGEVTLRQEALLASQFEGRLAGFSLLMGDPVKKGAKIGVIIPPMREALLQVMGQIDESQREMLSKEIREIPLYCPIDGIVLKVYQHNGDVVQKGEAIVHIGQMRYLDIHGDIPLAYLTLVKKIKFIHVVFVNYPHKPLILKVQAIGGKVDQAKQTVPVRLGLDNRDGEFKPGMLVRLYFPGQLHKDALTIPRTALLEEEGVFSAFVLQKNNTVEKRHITLGIIQDDHVEVLSGLKEGERVATQNAYSLTDGMEVIAE